VDAVLAGEKPLPDATLAYLGSIVPGAEISPLSAGNLAAQHGKSSPNSLFFVRQEGEISSPQPSNSDSKSAKSESKIGQIHPENTSEQIVESVYGGSDLFVPLTQPAR
jgi:hypothetical protein